MKRETENIVNEVADEMKDIFDEHVIEDVKEYVRKKLESEIYWG